MVRYHARRKTVESFLLAAAQGKLVGHLNMHKFGRNIDCDIGNSQIIWDGGGSTYNWPTTACTLSVQSTSASDSSGSSGAQTVELVGLDADFVDLSETVPLNGTTTVTSACNYRRIFRMIVRSAGSDGKNEGEISACGNGGGLAYISASMNQTLMAIHTVAASTDAYLQKYYASVNVSGGATERQVADICFFARPFEEVFQVKEVISITTDNGPLIRKYDSPVRYPEKTDLYISACVTANNTDVSAGFDLLLIAAS